MFGIQTPATTTAPASQSFQFGGIFSNPTRPVAATTTAPTLSFGGFGVPANTSVSSLGSTGTGLFSTAANPAATSGTAGSSGSFFAPVTSATGKYNSADVGVVRKME